MSYDRDDARAEIAAALAAAGPAPGGSETVDILDGEKITAMLAEEQAGRRPRVYLLVIGKYAPAGTEGWVYTVERVNKTTVTIVPVGGGRGLRANPFTLAEADPDTLDAYLAKRAAEPAVHELHTGSVVRIAGDGWRQAEGALWVVVALKGMEHIAVARLGGEASGRMFPKIPRSYVQAVITGPELGRALTLDPAFS